MRMVFFEELKQSLIVNYCSYEHVMSHYGVTRVGLRWKVVGDMTGWLGSSVVRFAVSERPWFRVPVEKQLACVVTIKRRANDIRNYNSPNMWSKCLNLDVLTIIPNVTLIFPRLMSCETWSHGYPHFPITNIYTIKQILICRKI